MGDAQWTSEEAALNLDTTLFYENFVRTFIDTQDVGCNHVAETVLNDNSGRRVTASALAVGNGKFVICHNCTDPAKVYWLDANHTLHHIAGCQMCNHNLCADLTAITPEEKRSCTSGSDFSCQMAGFPPPPPPPPPHFIQPGRSRPPTYECCSRAKPTFGCDWTGVNDSFIDAHGSLPDVVPYTRKTYGGWPVRS